MRTALYFLCFALLLPCEILIWAYALDQSLADTYLARRVSLSIFMDIPRSVLGIAAAGMLWGILRSCSALAKGSHAKDALLYINFVTLTGILFLWLRLPCSFAIILPLLAAACTAAWYCTLSRHTERELLLSHEMSRRAFFPERFRAFHLLFAIQCGGCLLFQGGYQFWLAFPVTSLIVCIPFAGLIQRSPGQLREYVTGCFQGLLLCAFLYGSSQFFLDDIHLSDLSIFFAALFIVLQLMLTLRQWAGRNVRNLSVYLLLPAAAVSYYILLPICSFLLVSFFAFIFYIVIDNFHLISRFLFSFAHKRKARLNFFSEDEYKAIAWGGGTILTAYLLGPEHCKEVLICTGVLLGGSLIRTRFLSDRQDDHIILKNFPYIGEVILLGSALLILSPSKADLVISLCAFSCSAAVMQGIWHTGRVLGQFHSNSNGPVLQLFLAYSWSLLGILMILLYFWQLPAYLYLGIFLILSGVIHVWGSMCQTRDEERKLTAGWVLVVLGQFISVTSPEIILPVPEWYQAIWFCGFLAFASLYIFRLLDFRNRNKDMHP